MVRFATALSCIDGRIQRPVYDFLQARLGVAHVDTVTRAGIVKHLTSSYDSATRTIIQDLEASMGAHGSTEIALVAHHDCAGNAVDDAVQQTQLRDAVDHFRRRFPEADVFGVWVGDSWTADIIS